MVFLMMLILPALNLAQDWEEIIKLVASDRSQGARLGWSVSLSGDYAIVGATGDFSYKGATYIFVRNGNSWVQQQKLVASDGDVSESFGYSVCISEEYAIVGAPYDDHNVSHSDSLRNAGSAYIFKRDGSIWIEQQKLVPSNRRREDYFGMAVSINGDYAIIGAPLKEHYISVFDSVKNAGAAYIFKLNNNVWIEQQKLVALNPQSEAWFGNAVSLSGDYAVVGAFEEDTNPNYVDSLDAGAAYVFKRTDSTWSPSPRIVPDDLYPSDGFGTSVFISGDYIIIGSPDHSFDTTNVVTPQAGAAYIYMREDTNWNLKQKIFEPSRYRNHHFGQSVSLSGNYAIAGSGGAYAYIFDRSSSIWLLQKKLEASDHSAVSDFGFSVSVSGEYAVVGAYSEYRDTSGGNSLSNAGAAYIFKSTPGTGVEDTKNDEIPLSFNLYQNYPNPFNPSTRISWQSPVGSHQTIKVFDVLGNEIATLVDEFKPAGRYEFEFNPESSIKNLASGIYLYQLKVSYPEINSGQSVLVQQKMEFGVN